MSFRYVYAALAVVPILIYPVATKEVLVPQDYCNVDIAEIQSFGKSTGSPWCAMRVKDGVFINGVKTWSGPLEGWSLVPLGLTTGLEVSYTDGSTAMFGEQTGPWYDEISWDPAKVSVDWLTASDIALTGEFVDVDPDTWMNRLQIMLTDGQYLCSGGNREVESNSGCEKDKPKDPRHWLGGSLLGFSGATGSGGIEAITVYFLKSDAENTEIHDVVLSPTIEELNKRPPE